MSLHLLRGVPPNINGEKINVDAFKRLVRRWANEPGTVFGSWTRNAPRRVDELAGGSVYFVHQRETLFRMPFLGIEAVRDFSPDAPARFQNHVAIVCAPHMVMVQRWPIRFLRGWRYLRAEDAPPDLPTIEIADVDMPPEMVADLKREGLI